MDLYEIFLGADLKCIDSNCGVSLIGIELLEKFVSDISRKVLLLPLYEDTQSRDVERIANFIRSC